MLFATLLWPWWIGSPHLHYYIILVPCIGPNWLTEWVFLLCTMYTTCLAPIVFRKCKWATQKEGFFVYWQLWSLESTRNAQRGKSKGGKKYTVRIFCENTSHFMSPQRLSSQQEEKLRIFFPFHKNIPPLFLSLCALFHCYCSSAFLLVAQSLHVKLVHVYMVCSQIPLTR